MNNLREDLYDTLFSRLIDLEELFNIESKDENAFEKHFGKDVFDLIDDICDKVVGDSSNQEDDYTDDEYDKLIVLFKALIEQIQNKRRELDYEDYRTKHAAEIATWSPDKRVAWEKYRAKLGLNDQS